MKSWFLGFSVRDQAALLIMAGAIALYVLFMLVIFPVQNARSELDQRNLATAEALQRVDAMASEIRALKAEGGTQRSGRRRNLTALLNNSADRFELRISRLQPNSRGAVQLRFETVPFEALLRWVHELETSQGLLIEELSLSQTGTAGAVSASLRVAPLG